MSSPMPQVPAGSGQHPIVLIVLSANRLEASGAFYRDVFGWQLQPMSAELTGAVAPGGPMIALRANLPEGFPAAIPYLAVPQVEAALAAVVADGATEERAPWTIPGVGRMARFKDASGTIYGLTTATSPDAVKPVPMPFGDNPKPPANTICSLEMYAADGHAAGRFMQGRFGWGAQETMPQYVAFDPGAGIGGVFQSHTPAAPAMVYIYSNDVAATVVSLEAAGGKRMCEPMSMPGMGTFGYFTDPSGTPMGLIGP